MFENRSNIIDQGSDAPFDVGLDSAQRIVGAQFEDHDIGFLGKRAVHTGEAAGGGVSRNPRVHTRAASPLSPANALRVGPGKPPLAEPRVQR